MKGFMKRNLAMLCVASGLASAGCAGNGKLVDPCPLERYGAGARQEVITAFTPQVQNGRILDQTVWNYHFEAGTDRLNAGGLDKLDQLVRRRPEPDTRIFLATARDLSYNPDKVDEYADARRDLDSKRSTAIQKYLAAQTAGRPIGFDVLIHDPAETGISGVGARNASNSQRNAYTGTISGGSSGGSSGAQGGGGQGSGGAGAQGGGMQGGGGTGTGGR